MTITIMFWLHLTLCPNHVRDDRCETKMYLCHQQLCFELIAEKKPTGVMMVRIP